MRLLFDDALAPVTSEVGFIEAPAEKIADWYADWDRSIQAKRGGDVVRRDVNGDLNRILRTLLPLTTVVERRVLFVPTVSSWTAFFDNGHRGTNAARGALLARELGCRAIRVVAIPDTLGRTIDRSKKGRYGASIFELYGPLAAEWMNYLRTICALNDGGRWTFEARGEVLPFEHRETYTASRPKDRFPHELLDEYLRAFGIRAFDEDFYVPTRTAILLERTGPKPDRMQEFSLEQVRAEFGAG